MLDDVRSDGRDVVFGAEYEEGGDLVKRRGVVFTIVIPSSKGGNMSVIEAHIRMNHHALSVIDRLQQMRNIPPFISS